ncbi:MAG: hypothetical protein ACOCWL_02505 [Thermoguttaceae bacterium]
MKHELPELPFAETALEPHISAEALQYHHGGLTHRVGHDRLELLAFPPKSRKSPKSASPLER